MPIVVHGKSALKPATLILRFVLLAAIAGCKASSARDAAKPLPVKVYRVALVEYAPSLVLTGEVAARVQSDLSFKISGRLVERRVDVGSEVTDQELLARLEPTEQQADVEAAAATVQASEAKLRQVTASYERQRSLLQQGFTTRRDYDNTVQEYESAKSALDNASAQLATAQDQLAHAELRAPAAGIITSRYMEVGQVAQTAQRVFTLARTGPRDVLVNVQEAVVASLLRSKIKITLANDPQTSTGGTVREVAPSLDAATGTVRVKFSLDDVPAAMVLGSTVTVTSRAEPEPSIQVPSQALTSQLGAPCVWVVDPQSHAVTLRSVAILSFENATVVLRRGLQEGDLVVTGGSQLLREGQIVLPVSEQGARP